MDYSAPNKALTTHQRDRSRPQHLMQAFGDLTLREMRSSLIAAHKSKRRVGGAAAKTINNELTLLSHAFQLAVKEWEWVAENPVQKVSKEKVRNLIERWLTEEEGVSWRPLPYGFAANTGLWQSEILNLQRCNVDLFRRTITAVGTKERRQRHAPSECEDTRRAESLSKSSIAQNGFGLLQRAGNRMDARDLSRVFYPITTHQALPGREA
jgi:site-specific recombinase XerD